MKPYQIELLRHYQDDADNRQYHGMNHILDLLQLFRMNNVPGLEPLKFKEEDMIWSHDSAGLDQLVFDPDIIEAAIYGHDVIYDTNSKTNEEDSAELTSEILRRNGWPRRSIQKVDVMIRASKTHEIPEWEVEHNPAFANEIALFLSMDLAQLGASWGVFNKNTDAIRFEYRQYDDEQWAFGRTKFFQSMLDKDVIFPHPLAEASWGDQARLNMEEGLRLLNKR